MLQYQVEEIKEEKKKKNIYLYIVILVICLAISITLGIYTVNYTFNNKNEHQNDEIFIPKNEEENSNIENQQQNITAEQENVENETEKVNKFINNIDNIYNGEEGERVFLTFDDGPSETVTPHILDTLKKNNIKATFFVLGSRVKLNPELVKREYEEGHYIANHGYSHKYNEIYKNSKKVIDEYNETEKEIRKAIGNNSYESHLFRFPGGSVGGGYSKIKNEAKKLLAKNSIAYLDWNALTNDADGANTKQKIMKNLKETVGDYNNVVILMHDAPDKILTYETLEEVINYLKNKGYSFKNAYDLI